MPDLATHALATRLLAVSHPRIKRILVPLLIGAVLPDVLTRPVYMIFSDLFWFVFPLHCPIPLFFVCYAAVFIFEENERAGIFMGLFGGALLHIAVDLLQKNVTLAYAPLFPFTWKTWSAGLLWPDQTLLLLPLFLLMNMGIDLVLSGRRRKVSGEKN
jgi:hypothetical protein